MALERLLLFVPPVNPQNRSYRSAAYSVATTERLEVVLGLMAMLAAVAGGRSSRRLSRSPAQLERRTLHRPNCSQSPSSFCSNTCAGYLVNFGKILERQRGGYANDIGINGLQGQYLACLQIMNEAGSRHASGDAAIGEANHIRNLNGRALVDSQFDARLQELSGRSENL